ncbi:hypothetical protein HHL16_09095 [Pseudoflavitalea sp. G-6-1-2]|uniref:hypothetical protein n=1 Tax=Pseudoflavitalea sp. G-6-1-2 TaxID=2728841 RepID=UPI00146C124B|nr:hypothetical protein [Pseudoflavitalea sp. G-6-1-2]NML21027.1 hypothetical protein [Pseudoflavitalea sp. G-6-1-2]
MRIILSITVFCLFCLSLSCKKGDRGEQGEPGIPGINGNANVVQYNFGQADLRTGYVVFNITTTQDTVDNSQWYVYLFEPGLERWYALPGQGLSGNTTYRVSIGYTSPNAKIYIDRNGPGELYSKTRVIRVYAGKITKLGVSPNLHSRAGIDPSDYEAMRKFYHLPEN